MFQWALLCELTLTLLFWLYLWVVCSDLSSMTRDQFLDKLRYDLLEDVENYNHSIPVVLLLAEFWVNNIPFSWLHYLIVVLINFGYLFF
jgi:hypothetical protein